MFMMADKSLSPRLRGYRLLGISLVAINLLVCGTAFARPTSTAQRNAIAAHRKVNTPSLPRSARVARAAMAGVGPFHRGDVFLANSGGIQEYSPAGQLEQTVSDEAGPFCFSRNADRLIVVGVGLFSASGTQLSSDWASDTGGECVVDGAGDVYVAASTGWSVTKYDTQGDPLQTYTLASMPSLFDGFGTLDLAPDDCTLYYGTWDGFYGGIGRFNACTNTQEADLASGLPTDDMRVLPNWQVIATDDPDAMLLSASGQRLQRYIPGSPPLSNTLRSVALDPDGTSFWVTSSAYTSRFDIASGRQLSEWPGGGPIAIYGPPVAGNANIEPDADTNVAGTAYAFRITPSYSGDLSSLHFYVDSTSKAKEIELGIYADKNGAPGALEASATVSSVQAGSWNYVTLPAGASVTASHRVWIAMLSPKGSGTIGFQDDADTTTGSITSSQTTLKALPTKWSSGTRWPGGNLSVFAN
jgi:hypothetical protein